MRLNLLGFFNLHGPSLHGLLVCTGSTGVHLLAWAGVAVLEDVLQHRPVCFYGAVYGEAWGPERVGMVNKDL